jgi:hypothetical protein
MLRGLLLILFLMIGVLVLVSPDQIVIDAVFTFLPALGLIALGLAVMARR